MSLAVPEVMAGIGNRLRTLEGLRVFDYPADNLSPPMAVVAFPEGDVEYDAQGHADRAEFVVFVVVGRVSERSGYAALAAYMSGSGTSSVKAAIEADPTLGGAADGGTTRVTSSRIESVVTSAGVEYLAASFSVDVVA
jgi:hypothetical protein